MATRVYALLVINDYPPEVGKLAGCLNDVDHFHAHLSGNFDKANLAIRGLKAMPHKQKSRAEALLKRYESHPTEFA